MNVPNPIIESPSKTSGILAYLVKNINT